MPATAQARPVITDSPGRWATPILLLLVLIPIAFNAVTLWPEVSRPVPSLNDDAVHYLFIQRASEALGRGENPFDHWLPEVEFGFPTFFYYQHLPHLTVIALHRLLLQQVDLLTLFNLVRYLLLVVFPLTVYWSMRRLGFSVVAAAVAAASASLVSSNHRYGFEYDSYIWRGHGMYTQLWAMHLSFVVLACLHRLLERGRGYVPAVLSCSVLSLSHLIYAYMMAITALVLFLVGVRRSNWRARLGRLAVTGGLAAVISSYVWLPFLLETAYLSASPYLQRWKYDSFGAGGILAWLVNGDLLDYGRLPVLTVLLALGVAGAIFARTRPAQVARMLFVVWLPLYFGRPTWGALVDLLPMHEGLLLHRFIGSVDMAAILLIGLGGEWIWRQSVPLPERWRAVAFGLVLLALLAPALRERQQFYSFNTQWIERTRKALDADADARAILSALRELPPGRTHAGLRANWGKDLKLADLHFYDLLTFHRVVAASPPYSGWSLNADLIWHFDDRNPAHYNLFNVKYVVAPRGLRVAEFLRPIKETGRYVLYRAETGGYADFVAVTKRRSVGSESSLFFQNRDWFLSAEPAAGRFVRYDYPAGKGGTAEAAAPPTVAQPGCPGGKISEERVSPGRLDLRVECEAASTVVLKVTYHPNWQVSVDGRKVQSFMLSPSFIGLELPAGGHHIRAEYRSGPLKMVLLLVGAAALLATLLLGRRFTRLDALAFSSGPDLTGANESRVAPRSLHGRASAKASADVSAPAGREAWARRLYPYADGLRFLCASAALLALAILAVRSATRLELRWDTFAYHIPFAALRGGLGIPYELNDRLQEYYAGFPPLPEFVQGLLWRATGSINATGVANYLAFCLFLVFCHVKLQARFWLVALIALTAPLVLIHTTVSYVDLFGNCFLAIGISSFVYGYLFDRYHDRTLLLWGLGGLVVAAWSKYMMVPIVAAFLVAFALVYLRARSVSTGKRLPLLRLVLVAAAIATLPYVKNLAAHGNPFWPFRVPVAGELLPYKEDSRVIALQERPPPLMHLRQFELFFHSLLEINHPTSYPHRERWIIDQGNAWVAFRMGGLWNVSVVVYLLATAGMALLFDRRKGIYVASGGALLIAFVAALPESHHLRYYLFLPLCWAATIAMLFPEISRRYERIALGGSVVVLSLFLYMSAVNWTHYRIERVGYAEAAQRWGASQWWSTLKPGPRYCVVDMIPLGILMTGPTMSEFTIIDRSAAKMCPKGSVVIQKDA